MPPLQIDVDLVTRLVAEQLPQWRHLPVEPVPEQGHDNRTFRLGDELSVRLPSAEGYVAGVEKEQRVLPVLAPHLPVPVPEPVATGRPGCGYPFPWSVRRWIDGETLDRGAGLDQHALARDIGGFLTALRTVVATGGPAAGRHSFFRGCSPSAYGDEVEESLRTRGVDGERCRDVWLAATTGAWSHPPVWFHGDMAVGNLLVRDGRLAAVIDFGTCGVGDPACDLVLAWTFFDAPARQVLRAAAGLPGDAWQRARGWAMWKALVTTAPDGERVLGEVLADPVARG